MGEWVDVYMIRLGVERLRFQGRYGIVLVVRFRAQQEYDMINTS